MSDYWDNLAEEFRKEGFSAGKEEERRLNEIKENESILTMLKKGLDVSLISEITKKSTSEILSIKQSNKL